MSWEEKTIIIPNQVARLPQKQQHVGTSRTPANSAAPKGVSLSPPPQQYKSNCCTMKTPSPILASSSYCTHSYYPLESLALYWNLPLPTWNLGDDTLDLPTPHQKKPKQQRNKRKGQPLKHQYTHTTFCRDPLCIYHR